MSKTQFSEMINKIKVNMVFSVVLKKGGSTHNIVVRELGEQNIFGNVALQRIMAMFDVKNHPKCEFGFYDNAQQLESKKDINVIESTGAFICLPRIVIIPYDNIGLLEEGPFAYIESSNMIGSEVKIEDQLVLDKFPIFKPYYSKEVGGFYQSPILVKKVSSNTIPFPKVSKGRNIIKGEVKEIGDKKENE